MKLGAFVERLRYILRRDGNLPSPQILEDIIMQSARNILSSYEILDYIEIDRKGFNNLRDINDIFFIKDFEIKNDEIKFDDFNVLSALLYNVAKEISIEDKDGLQIKYFKNIGMYQMAKFLPKLDTLEKVLTHWGYAKPYSINYAINPYYLWDENFLNNLDTYMSDTPKRRGLGYERFIELFILFQNKEIFRNDLDNLDKTMSSRKNLNAVLKSIKER